jgi:ribonuclease D
MLMSAEIEAAQSAASQPRLVESNRQLEDSIREWRACPILGVDTEFLRERTFRAELGLIQVSDGKTAWLIDPLRIEQPEVLANWFQEPSILKVFHSASEDLEVLWLTLGASPAPMVDTQIACALLGQPLQLSYHGAVKSLTGIEVDKEQTRSNWLSRPLKPAQLHYAACDVVFLPLLFRELQHRLKDQNRWRWLEEEVAAMRRQSQQNPEPGGAYLRIRGAGRLRQDELRILRALARWREETAMARNMARGFVVADATLLEIALRVPKSLQELKTINGLHPRALQKYGDHIIQLVQDAEHSQAVVEGVPVLDKKQQCQLDLLRNLVRERASELGVDPALLASKKVLEALILSRAAGTEIPERLQGWRKSILADALIRSLDAVR